MAGETIQIGKFGPRVTLRVARDALVQLLAQLHGLSGCQHANVGEGVILRIYRQQRALFQCRGIAAVNDASSKYRSGWPAAIISWSTALSAVPRWHVRQFSARRTGSRRSRMPAAIERSCVQPLGGVRAQPVRRRPVAGFAAHAVGGIERPGAVRLRHAQRVASQTLRRGVRFIDPQNLGHARGHGIRQHRKRVRMLVLDHPGAVLVLLHGSSRCEPALRHGSWAKRTNRARYISAAPQSGPSSSPDQQCQHRQLDASFSHHTRCRYP